jgi:Mg2+-importing ATPase
VTDERAAPEAYWSRTAEQLMASLPAAPGGLTTIDAAQRLQRYGANALAATGASGPIRLFANQFKSPLVLILVIASIISMAASEWIDAAVVLVIVLGSTVLGFVQEYIAARPSKSCDRRSRSPRPSCAMASPARCHRPRSCLATSSCSPRAA